MSRRFESERRPSDFHARRDRFHNDADRGGPSPGRFRGSPPPGSYRRRSSDHHEDSRDWDRSRDAPPSHKSPPMSRRPSSVLSTPHGADKMPDQQQAQPSTKSAITGEPSHIKAFTSLICEKATWVQKKQDAVKNLTKLRADHARSGTKHVEFASVVEMFQNQMKTGENEVATCDKRIKGLDEKLASDFASLAPILSEPARSQDEDLNKRLMQLQNSTAESFRFQLDSELNKLKGRFESDLQALRTQYEVSHGQESKLASENEDLRRNLDDITQKYNQLEKKFESLEKKQEGTFAALNLRLTVQHEQIEGKFADTESRSANNSQDKDDHTKKAIEEYSNKLSDLKGILDSTRQDVKTIQGDLTNLAPNTILPVVEEISKKVAAQQDLLVPVTVLPAVEELSKKLAVQQDILVTLRPLEALVHKSPDLQVLFEKLPQLEELTMNLPMIRSLIKKLPSLQELVQQLPNIPKLQDDIVNLLKSAKTTQEKAEAAVVKAQACSDLPSKYESLMTDLQNHRDSMKKDVASLQSSLQSTTSRITDDISQLHKRLLQASPQLEPIQNTPSEDDVMRIIKSQLADLETALAQKPQPHVFKPIKEPSNAIAEADVLRIMTPRLEKVENGLVERFQSHFNGIADGVGKFIDKERTARLSTDATVKELEERAIGLRQTADEAREENVKWKATIDTQIQQQDTSCMAQRRELSILKNHLAQIHHDLGERMNTHQFQILHLDNWANHFGTKQLYAEIVEHMAATVPSGELVRRLSERVEALEDRAEDAQFKKRKLMNGNAAMA